MFGPFRSRQRGQILAIFAGGLITLLVIGALVVDLGSAFMIRRAEQNAADPGAIAAARFIRATPPAPDLTAMRLAMRQAACFYARANGFFQSATDDNGCIPGNDSNATVLTVNYPPSAAAGTFAGSMGKVEVSLTRQHRTFLANVVGIAQIGVSSSAVAAFDDGPSNTSSLIALDPTNACPGGKTHGDGAITIHSVVAGMDGGYIHINSKCGNTPIDGHCETGGGQGGLDIAGSGAVTAPHTYVVGSCKGNEVQPPGSLTEGSVVIGDPLLELKPPTFGQPNPGAECGVGSGNFTTPTGSGSGGCKFNGSGVVDLAPGVYYGGWDITGHPDLVLAPGIYVIAGGGIKFTGGDISSVQGGAGAPAPVMIFNTDNPVSKTGQGPLTLNSSGDLLLHGLELGPYKGILVWNDGKGSNPTAAVSLGGQANLDISGTIYSPKGFVKLEGGGGVAGSTNKASVQIIAWQFDIGGNFTLDMPYDPSLLYQFPEKGLVR